MLHIKGVQSAQAHQLSTINILLTNLLKFLKLGRNHSLSDLLFVARNGPTYCVLHLGVLNIYCMSRTTKITVCYLQ